MNHPVDAYSDKDIKTMLGERVYRDADAAKSVLSNAQQGTVIGSEALQIVPGVVENHIYVQWDDSDKAVRYGKLNEGKDFHRSPVQENSKNANQGQEATCPSGLPASRQQVDALRTMQSAGPLEQGRSLKGTVQHGYNPDHDRKINATIQSTEAKLTEQKHKAMERFNDVSQTRSKSMNNGM